MSKKDPKEEQGKEAPAGEPEKEGSAEAGEAAPAPGKKKRKKLILIVAGAVVVVALVAGGLFAGGVFGGKDKTEQAVEETSAMDEMGQPPSDSKKAKSEKKGEEGDSYFKDLPEMVVNLNTAQGEQDHFLKVSLSLEVASEEDAKKLDKTMPRIIDQFQTCMREMRVDDLRGSAGIYRLRQELMSRAEAATDSVKIKDVLFREILVQ